jgi:AcrR family transcriptional regulator
MVRATKTLILDAAEKLFADHGFAGTSMRMITREAGVNVAAINYHFGSKESLLAAVLDRIVRPVNEERLDRLAEAEAEAGEQGPTVEAILSAFIAPDLELIHDLGERGVIIARFLGRTSTEPAEFVQGLVQEQFGALGRSFLAALGRAIPDLPAEELRWRLTALIAVITSMLTWRPGEDTRALLDPDDVEATTRRFVAFAAAGMRAPLPELSTGRAT